MVAMPVLWCLQARADIQIKATKPITVKDVQQLVLWVMGEGSAPKWAMIQVRRAAAGAGAGSTPESCRKQTQQLSSTAQCVV